jgi:hypothetical protein
MRKAGRPAAGGSDDECKSLNIFDAVHGRR